MRPDEIDRPAAGAKTAGYADDHDATRRVRENDLVRELDEVTARSPKPPAISHDREEPSGSGNP